MNPNVWGPAFWFVLHTVSLNYPQQPGFLERRNHYDFFRLLQYVLPCDTCRSHYSQYFKSFPVENFLGSKEGLCTWVTNLHNYVNKRNGKAEFTQEDSNQLYKSIYTGSSFSPNGLENYFCKSLMQKLSTDEEKVGAGKLPKDSGGYSSFTYWISVILLVVTIVVILVTNTLFVNYYSSSLKF